MMVHGHGDEAFAWYSNEFCSNDLNFHNQVVASKSMILFEFEPFF
jgi:hypothetical protein